jgi:hypothetical protein
MLTDGMVPQICFASPSRLLSLTVANAALAEIDHVLLTVLSRIKPNHFVRRTGQLYASKIYEIAPPAGGSHPFELVIYTPESNPQSSVLITNRADGWNSLSYLIAEQHRKLQAQMLSTQADTAYHKNRFQIWRDGKSCRIVVLIKDDDECVFYQKGHVEIFENIDVYKGTLKKNRLTRDVLGSVEIQDSPGPRFLIQAPQRSLRWIVLALRTRSG